MLKSAQDDDGYEDDDFEPDLDGIQVDAESIE